MATKRSLFFLPSKVSCSIHPQSIRPTWSITRRHYTKLCTSKLGHVPRPIASIQATPKRTFSTTILKREEQVSPAEKKPSKSEIKSYSFEDVRNMVEEPNPDRILIDVREPAELEATGRIPSSHNLPISSSPDFPFMPAEEFEEKFGFQRPDESKEVVFYCKAGVRSRAASRLAQQAGFGGKFGEFPGSWVEWEGRGGSVER